MTAPEQPEIHSVLHTLPAEEFVRRLHAYTVSSKTEAQYAFFIGAGCSITSGIPSAKSLIRDIWIPRLRNVRAPHETDAIAWAKRDLGVVIEPLSQGAYGDILTALLPNPALRQAEMEQLCSSARPGFGYATLAQLMEQARSHFNVVLTTNFDDLLVDALYLFAGVHPLVIQHGSLSPFIRATRTRPLVVKLHGHHQFSPLNTREETQQIDPGLATGVRSLLHDRGLIFIGYSGNDDGIRDVLEQLPDEALPFGVYWVGGQEPSGSIRPWLEERGATWVQHRDFDELMVHVRDVFELSMPTVKKVEDVFISVQQDYLSLSKRIRSTVGTRPEDVALRDATDRVDKSVRDWAVYELRAQRYKSSDPDQTKAAYRDGLQALPESVPLLGNFANFLKDFGELDEAESLYQRALEIDSDYPIALHDYAVFLWRYRGNEGKARELMHKAMELDPGDAIRSSNYGNFLWMVEHEPDEAERMFQLAISIPSFSAEPYRQYAFFAQMEREEYGLADSLYVEAESRAPNDVVTLVNRASLATIMGDIEVAEQLLERAYAAADDDINVLGAFANFLWAQRIDLDRAQNLYEAARKRTPRYAYETEYYVGILISNASFLARERNEIQEGMALLKHADALLPDDPRVRSAIASHRFHFENQGQRALDILDRAIAEMGESHYLLGTKAQLIKEIRGDAKTAERLYRRALELAPSTAVYMVNLAGILLAAGNQEEGLRLTRRAIRKVGRQDPDILLESYFYLFAHSDQPERQNALRILKWILNEGGRSRGWNFEDNIRRAVADDHPDADWLPRLAAVISGTEDIAVLSDWVEWEQAVPPRPIERSDS